MERRRHKRYPVENVQGTVVLKSDARIINMSVGGMTLETNHGLRMGRPLTVTVGDAGEPLRLSGIIVRCQLVGTRVLPSGEVEPVFRAGLRLDGMLTEQAEEVLGFLREHARIEVERRLFGRFTIREGQSVVVESECPFQVVTLSLSGMRVEAPRGVQPGSRVEVDLDLHAAAVHTPVRVVDSSLARHAEGVDPGHWIDLEFIALGDLERHALEDFVRRELEASGEVGAVPGPEAD